MLDDVELIVRASGVPPERIIFFGRSLGSLYALHGAARYPRAAGLIIESGLADPLERILVRIEPRQLGTSLIALPDGVGAVAAGAVGAEAGLRSKKLAGSGAEDAGSSGFEGSCGGNTQSS